MLWTWKKRGGPSPCTKIISLHGPASVLLVLFISVIALAQDIPTGSLEVSARMRIDGNQEKLAHLRFYLIRGNLKDNAALLDRIRNTEIVTRNCFYKKANASSQFICWLTTENCDSPYCRKIEMPDIERVPEFKIAYQKGLSLFGNKSDIAQHWLPTALPPLLTSGFFKEQRSDLEKILAGIKPVQSAITDSVSAKAQFIDIPVNTSESRTSETFIVSNLRPLEFSRKSYVWACQVEISPEKPATVRLQVPENDRPIRNCELVVKELRICEATGCERK